jgi:hypothetical protein
MWRLAAAEKKRRSRQTRRHKQRQQTHCSSNLPGCRSQRAHSKSRLPEGIEECSSISSAWLSSQSESKMQRVCTVSQYFKEIPPHFLPVGWWRNDLRITSPFPNALIGISEQNYQFIQGHCTHLRDLEPLMHRGASTTLAKCDPSDLYCLRLGKRPARVNGRYQSGHEVRAMWKAAHVSGAPALRANSATPSQSAVQPESMPIWQRIRPINLIFGSQISS